MAKATWNDAILAESEATQIVDGFTYFPRDAVRWENVKENAHRST